MPRRPIRVPLHRACAQRLKFPTPGTPRTPDGKPNLAAAVPRAPDGKPDLAGVWMHEITTVAEVRRLFGDGFEAAIKTNSIGMEIGTQHKYGFDFLVAADICTGVTGIPVAGFLSEPIKIVQAPRETMIFLYEAGNLHRQVFTDGRTLPKEFDLPAFLVTRSGIGRAIRSWGKPPASTIKPPSMGWAIRLAMRCVSRNGSTAATSDIRRSK